MFDVVILLAVVYLAWTNQGLKRVVEELQDELDDLLEDLSPASFVDGDLYVTGNIFAADDVHAKLGEDAVRTAAINDQ